LVIIQDAGAFSRLLGGGSVSQKKRPDLLLVRKTISFMEHEKRHRTIYLLQYTDEEGRPKQSWYATRRQAEMAAKESKRNCEIKPAKV
jgi:hypothetical protein